MENDIRIAAVVDRSQDSVADLLTRVASATEPTRSLYPCVNS